MMVFTQPPYLAGCTVRHASTLITGQVEVGRTGTLVASSRSKETEVATASIVRLAWVVEHWQRDRQSGNIMSDCMDISQHKIAVL